MSDKTTERNASQTDAYVDGYIAALDSSEREPPAVFTLAAQTEWLHGYDRGCEVLNGKV